MGQRLLRCTVYEESKKPHMLFPGKYDYIENENK